MTCGTPNKSLRLGHTLNKSIEQPKSLLEQKAARPSILIIGGTAVPGPRIGGRL
ncbi:MAG: hypothetical protein HF973_07095 [Chloroflexi bacterium]|nr:hypothetical protein [Chloroflexota bacterium]